MMGAELRFPYGRPPDGVTAWWRVEARSYSVVIDAERELYGSTGPLLEARWFEVIKTTPKGVWIAGRFCLRDARKRFACPTLHEAIESFVARKDRQIKILSNQLASAQKARDEAATYFELEYMRKI